MSLGLLAAFNQMQDNPGMPLAMGLLGGAQPGGSMQSGLMSGLMGMHPMGGLAAQLLGGMGVGGQFDVGGFAGGRVGPGKGVSPLGFGMHPLMLQALQGLR